MRGIGLLAGLLVVAPSAFGQTSRWNSEVLFEGDHGLGGAAVGDLDPDAAGNEVAAVNAAGEVWLVRRTGQRWEPQRIHQGGGELIMCAIGDVDPHHPGNELVGVGMVRGEESRSGAGQALLIRKDNGRWVSTRLFEDSHMLHGVAIGDVSARHKGNEVIVGGFNHRVTLLHLQAGVWKHETIYVGNDRMKTALVADVLPEHEGLEVVVCGSDGKVVAVWETQLGWRHQIIFSNPMGQSRIAAGEPGVLIGGDGGKVTMVRKPARQWLPEFVLRDSGKIRGVAIADVDDDVPGVELYACGYSKQVQQLTQDESGFWRTQVIFTAQRPLHHLVAGDFDANHPGLELVTCGHAGRLIALTGVAGLLAVDGRLRVQPVAAAVQADPLARLNQVGRGRGRGDGRARPVQRAALELRQPIAGIGRVQLAAGRIDQVAREGASTELHLDPTPSGACVTQSFLPHIYPGFSPLLRRQRTRHTLQTLKPQS